MTEPAESTIISDKTQEKQNIRREILEKQRAELLTSYGKVKGDILDQLFEVDKEINSIKPSFQDIIRKK